MEETKGPSVKLVLDSCNPLGIRLCTWELKYARFVHAELMTHRIFSRNSASSRAIPVEKMQKRILEDPALPLWWGKNQAGMQAKEEMTGKDLEDTKEDWLIARDLMLDVANRLSKRGLHKQLANRLTEPWMHITVIVSTTFHENWYMLRDHSNAQPEIAWPATQMHKIYDECEPTYVPAGSWHLPYVKGNDYDELRREGYTDDNVRLISAGRCARVSYLTHDGLRDPKEDIKLAEKLMDARPLHASPFEHVACSMNNEDRDGNFQGWMQLRKMIPGEAGPAEKRYLHCVPGTLEYKTRLKGG